VSYAAGIDDDQVGSIGDFTTAEAKSFEQFSYLLALILINFTAKSIYGESSHSML
jgi:hypothetical protein